MKKEKITFLKPKEGSLMGQWLIEQGTLVKITKADHYDLYGEVVN